VVAEEAVHSVVAAEEATVAKCTRQ
jgi:hypothetical protein